MREGFRDRRDGGRRLASRLLETGAGVSVVLALPRGGVPVGYEVASALGVPLDVFVVRKLGVPGQEELAMGAIASGGTRVVNLEVVSLLGIAESVLEAVAEREQRELARRERVYRGGRAMVEVAGRSVLLVDDGVATGSTMLAAVRSLRDLGASRIVVAAPIAARATAARLRVEADEAVFAVEAAWLDGISMWYDDFDQTSDAEVHELLAACAVRVSGSAAADTGGEAGRLEETEVPIEGGGVRLVADIAVPAVPRGVVVFAHGSGSGRKSPRNRRVAAVLQGAGLATVLADLLTADEDAIDQRTRHLRFDIPMLATRLVAITDRVALDPRFAGLAIGCFGASTGGAAAMIAAARRPTRVGAVVSRGGRPDLAMDALRVVRCPTLLIVGGLDFTVLELNREALAVLRCEKGLEIVPGSGHLFEEPGALDRAAGLARDWFLRHLRAPEGGAAAGGATERTGEGT